MMGGASKLDRDWKQDIITNSPEEEKQVEEDVPGSKELKELKADIVDAVDDGVRSKQALLDWLDYPDHEIKQAIALLRGEGVLEVVSNVR